MQQEVQSCTRRDSCCTVAETLWEVNNAFWIRQGRFRGCKLCVGVGRAKQQCNATQALPAKQVSFNGKCKSTGQKTLGKCAGTSFSLCFYFFFLDVFCKSGRPRRPDHGGPDQTHFCDPYPNVCVAPCLGLFSLVNLVL